LNVDYFIVHLLIEEISNTNYTSYVKTHVLTPMGISKMDTEYHEKLPICCYAKPGQLLSGEEVHGDTSQWAGPGGWYGSATDLGIFLEGIRHHKVLNKTTTEIMFKENLGWDFGNNPWAKGGLHVGPHHGAILTAIDYFPDGLETVILENCDGINGEGFPIKACKEARD
jgi:CubicO group peptidase (beta-lactamase class C family)